MTGHARPTTVEILGPPGSGKSALLEALQTSRSDIIPVSIYWRKPENLSTGMRSALSIAPIVSERASRRSFSVKHLVWMIRLEAALPIFRRKMVSSNAIAIFDQGPVYTMARLQDLGFRAAEGSRLRSWWERKLDEWARILDLLIVLDAPNEVLIERINKRSKAHVAKDQSKESAGRLVMDERSRYGDLADVLVQSRAVRVLHFDTSGRSIDEIKQAAIGALHDTQIMEKEI